MLTGFIFAGQGQQFLNMGHDIVVQYHVAKNIYDIASKHLNYDLLQLSEEDLSNTVYTQPALYTLNAALAAILNKKGINADYVCGLSLGEYNALINANVISFIEGLDIIEQRAQIMANAYEQNVTGMLACLKTDNETVLNIIKNSKLEVCNYNSPSQIVVGGMSEHIREMIPIFKQHKVIAIPLKVSTVSHCSLLDDASTELEKVLEKYAYNKPTNIFINNLNGEIQTDNFVNSLTKHISHPTHLAKCIQLMYESGVRHFIEVGPKGSISKLIKETLIDDKILISNVYDVESIEGVAYE